SLIAASVEPPVMKVAIWMWRSARMATASPLPKRLPGTGLSEAAGRACVTCVSQSVSQVVEPVDAEHGEDDDGEGEEETGDEHLGTPQRPPLSAAVDEGEEDQAGGAGTDQREDPEGDEVGLRADHEQLVEGQVEPLRGGH